MTWVLNACSTCTRPTHMSQQSLVNFWLSLSAETPGGGLWWRVMTVDGGVSASLCQSDWNICHLFVILRGNFTNYYNAGLIFIDIFEKMTLLRQSWAGQETPAVRWSNMCSYINNYIGPLYYTLKINPWALQNEVWSALVRVKDNRGLG